MNKFIYMICMMSSLMATGLAVAKLPPISEEAAAKSAETKAKDAWASKVSVYKLCLSQDKVVARYRQEKSATAQPGDATPTCSDPGPYVVASPTATSAVIPPAGLTAAMDAAAAAKK